MADFKGKTLFVSGGTRGIGKAIVYAFAESGADVAFTYASSADTAKNEIIADVESKYGVKARAYKLNILEPLTYKETFKEFDEDFDRLDYFISNAIISGRAVVGVLHHLCVLNQKVLETSTQQLLKHLLSVRKRLLREWRKMVVVLSLA